ncbi:MAG: hypothetical protein ACXAAH_04865 [Promethearchaeota archaeon]|jgi:hypothetical protein
MISLYDWLFFISGVIFFISISGIFISAAKENGKFLRGIGVIVISLLIPLIIVFIDYLVIGQELIRIVYILIIFAYLIVELLLDFIFKVKFREKISTHVPYIILEYAACFSFVFNTIEIDVVLGWIVSIFFWVMLASLVYYIVIKKKKEKEL